MPRGRQPRLQCRVCGGTAFLSSDLCFDCGRLKLFGWRAFDEHARIERDLESLPVYAKLAFTVGSVVFYLGPLLRFRWARDALALGVVAFALFWSRRSLGPQVVHLNRPPDAPTTADRIHAWLAGPVMQNALGSALLPLALLVIGQAIAFGWTPSSVPMAAYCIALVVFATTAAFASTAAATEDPHALSSVRKAYAASVAILWLTSFAASISLFIGALARIRESRYP